MSTKITRSTRLSRHAGVVVVFVLATFALASVSSAFVTEPNGWGKHAWGSTLTSVVKSNKELRKRHNLRKLNKALESQNVILTNETEFLDKTWGTQWYFNKEQGLYRVVLKFETTRSHDAHKKVQSDLEVAWGAPDRKTADGESVWKGEITTAKAKRIRVAMGSGLEIDLKANKFGAPKTTGAAPSKSSGDEPTKSFLDDSGEPF